MKTAEEKAKEYASKECPIIISGSMQTLTIDEWRELAERDYLAGYNEAYKIAFKEGQSNPKIKKLEWKENHFDIIADTLYGKYIVSKPVSGVAYIVYLNNNVITASFNLDEAKDFAQKDFEIRIKECLTTE